MSIKTGQTVKVMSGRDKGKTGKVIQVFPDQSRVVVEGVNKMYKHIKNRPRAASSRAPVSTKGERVEFFGPIHLSNVKSVEAAAEKPAKADKPAAKKTTKKSTAKAA